MTVNMAPVSVTSVVCLAFIFITLVLADEEDNSIDVINYEKQQFQTEITRKKHFVMFFAPWCGHCKRLSPTWNELAKIYNNEESPVTVAKVDCTLETALCSDNDVTGYPTLKFFHQKLDDFVRYKGNRDLDSLQKFVNEQIDRETLQESETPPVPEEKQIESPIELTEETFTPHIERGFHFVKFYAPWCGHCKHLAPRWDELAKSFSGSKQVSISKIDCTVSQTVCSQMEIRGYPTLWWFKDGVKIEQYNGERTHEELKAFVTRKLEEAEGAPHGTEEGKVPDDIKEESVLELGESNFEEKTTDGLTFIKFYAPWCGHCKRLIPTWEELGTTYADKPVTIARVDCTQHKSICDTNDVRGYPTLVMFRNGVRLDEYQGSRSLDDLQAFVNSFMNREDL